MKTPAVPVLIWAWLSLSGTHLPAQTGDHAPPPLSERIVSYAINARLDVTRKWVEGEEVLTWRNTTGFSATDLQFHLYYNAWLNDRSSYLTSARFEEQDLSEYREEDWAYCRVSEISVLGDTLNGEENLTALMEYIQPDDGNPNDRTVLRVPLSQAVMPGETVRVRIRWISKVPRTFARTGVRGDYYFIAQWFPKIGVFEQDGRWNCHQFIQTEFYADYGNYDVRLTVPTGWTVGATGEELERSDNPDGTTTHRFFQADVHDFAWVTSPYLREHHRLFEEPGLPKVDMRLLIMPDHAGKEERYFTSAATSLKYYGTWYGPYPYDHITIVDPAYKSGSGGMEYPTLFTGGTSWLSPPLTRSPESVTIHEAGHQFWYGLIGNNEFEDAWIDEGFNTYTQDRIFMKLWPPRVYSKRYLEDFIPVVFEDVHILNRTESADVYDGFYSELKRDRMSTPSYKYGPRGYRVNSYQKPAMILHTLENYLGWQIFQKVMSTFFQRWEFRHPRPQDFFDVVNEVSGQDMSWFFEQTYYSSSLFDYAVEKVLCEKPGPVKGRVDLDETPAAPPSDTARAQEGEQYLATIYVRRWGEATFPQDVQITFEDGEQITERWDGRSRWTSFEYRRPARVSRVEVDPQGVLVLDVNRSNNSWLRHAPAQKAAYKWASKWLIWYQSLIEFMAFFI